MTEREQLERAIAHMEAQRAILGDAAVEAALAPMREKLAVLAKAETPTPKLRGERKLVTVMFADISGFTALAETMDPEAVRDLINACFDHLVPAIEKYQGTVDKFVGDAIVALFGAPVAHENDPERALRAALEMMEALRVFNARHDTDIAVIKNELEVIKSNDLVHIQSDISEVKGDVKSLDSKLDGLIIEVMKK